MAGAPDQRTAPQWATPVPRQSWWRRLLPAAALVGLGILLLVTGTEPDDGAGDLAVGGEDDDSAAPDPDPPRARPAQPVDRLASAEGILYAQTRNSVVRVDLATGERTTRDLPPVREGYAVGPTVAVVGDTVVLARPHPPALALPRDLGGEPVELVGPLQDPDLAPAPNGRGPPLTPAVHAGPDGTATLVVHHPFGESHLVTVDLDEGTVSATDGIPAGARILHVAGRVAVLELAGEVFRHDFAAGHGVRLASGSPVASDGEQVVYVRCRPRRLACLLRTRPVTLGPSRTLGPAPAQFFSMSGSLSPDGRWLHYTVHAPAPSTHVLDLDTGAHVPRPVEEAEAGRESPPVTAWTPDGAWLLEADGTQVRAWHIARGEVTQLDLGTTRIEGLVVAP